MRGTWRRRHPARAVQRHHGAGRSRVDHARKRYGYDLLTSLGSASDGSIAIKEGTLYPALHRMEDAGYITAAWEAEGRTAPRKYYRILGTAKPGSRRCARSGTASRRGWRGC